MIMQIHVFPIFDATLPLSTFCACVRSFFSPSPPPTTIALSLKSDSILIVKCVWMRGIGEFSVDGAGVDERERKSFESMLQVRDPHQDSTPLVIDHHC